MEGIGPEPKRQRLEYNGSRALPPQPPPPPQSHSHTNSTLPPPHSYPPPQQPPPPPSPYEVAPHDQRSLPDPTPHAYVQEHSGHSTPIREQRFHPDSTFSRRNSGSAVARSPDGHHQYAPVRSMTSATAAEGQHFPPPQQHQYPADPGGHVPAYASNDPPPNGSIHHGLPMHGYDQAHGFPQPHPLEYTHSPVTAGPNPYGSVGYGVSYGQAGTRPLKKGNRATQACDVCRTRKAKCDEGRPECGFCVENSMRCNYQSVAPAKADRANQQIIDQLSAHKEDMRALKEDWGGRFDRIEQILLENIGAGKGLSAENQDVKPSLKVESPPRRSNGDAKTAPINTVSRVNTMDPPAVDESPTDSASNDAAATQNNAIYVEHDTAAQKLFRWRSIKALLKQAGLTPSDRTEEYVMSLEMNKGVLRYYGKGRQLRDAVPMSQASGSAASPAASSSSGPGSDEASSTGSPASPPENLWGTGFIPTISEPRPVSDAGGLNPDNTLKLDPKTINRLVKSYLNNIHILHPFLRESELTRLAEQFKQRYNPHDPSTSKASFAVPVAIDNLRGPKRKHSEGLYYNAPNEPSLAPSPMTLKILLERSPDTAIMLLVMALGRIAECREPLPGPVSDNIKDNVTTLARPYSPVRNQTGSPPASYPMRQSPSASSHTTTNTSAPSPMSVNRIPNSSPRSSVGEPPPARNVDVIPGLAYYAQATDILGNLTGYHELVTAQCCLLAGLYAGQLANSLESLTWIQAASRICRFLVKEPAFKTVREPKKELIKLAFWSSLQLESDILAELDIPPSGIQDVNDVPYPKGTMDQGDFVHGETDRPAVMIYYSFQLHMRKLLNDIQKELYQEKDANFKRATRATSLSNAFNTMINEWRARLPEHLQWDDHDPPADNINDARLRGKFYGAQYIIYRPFLHAALDYDFDAPDIHSPPGDNPIGLQNHVPFHSAPAPAPAPAPAMGPPAPIGDSLRRREETIDLAKRCIQAAMRSTVAFDGVLDHRRMVVTNIMGTAHAQFGNILVLSAAYKSRTLAGLVPKDHLERLFNRTIRLLGSCGPISETLKKDCAILESLRKAVFETESAEYSNSFSSE